MKKQFDTKSFLQEIEKDDKVIMELRQKNEKDVKDEFGEIKKRVELNLL